MEKENKTRTQQYTWAPPVVPPAEFKLGTCTVRVTPIQGAPYWLYSIYRNPTDKEPIRQQISWPCLQDIPPLTQKGR